MTPMSNPQYRWSHPYAWLKEASRNWDTERLRTELQRLAFHTDSDTIQDLYQSDMDADGYFDPSYTVDLP